MSRGGRFRYDDHDKAVAFAAYMTHAGANDMRLCWRRNLTVHKLALYLLMIAAYFVARLMSLAVSSATGFGRTAHGYLFPV